MQISIRGNLVLLASLGMIIVRSDFFDRFPDGWEVWMLYAIGKGFAPRYFPSMITAHRPIPAGFRACVTILGHTAACAPTKRRSSFDYQNRVIQENHCSPVTSVQPLFR